MKYLVAAITAALVALLVERWTRPGVDDRWWDGHTSGDDAGDGAWANRPAAHWPDPGPIATTTRT